MRGNVGRARRWPGLGLVAALAATSASAAPLDLSDATPRWVAVEFEVSPADRPAQLHTRFTRRLPARFEAGETPGEIRVQLKGHLVEKFLLPGERPLPGSFGDFTWIFDARTGHVRSAEVAGVLLREVGWGFARWKTEATIHVRMDTRAPVRFESIQLMGESVHRLCPGTRAVPCTVVEPRRFDPATGYVNAVGAITARSGALRVRSFSPLGEAVFSEIDTPFDSIWAHTREGNGQPDVAAPPRESPRLDR